MTQINEAQETQQGSMFVYTAPILCYFSLA